MRSLFTLLLTAFALVTTLFAGKFNCGMLSMSADQITLEIPRPPDAYPQIKSLKVEVGESDGRFRDNSRLKLQIEQALSTDFAISSPKPEAKLGVAVVAFDPPQVSYQQRTESRSIEVSKGKFETQNATVTYWVGKARISLRIDLLDADGLLLDSFNPEFVFAETREHAVNGKPSSQVEVQKNKAWIPLSIKPKSTTSIASVPTTEQDVNGIVLDQIAAQIRRRYVRTVDPVTFKLACDDELRQGNKLVLGPTPDWDAAIRLWEAATVKNKDNQGDKAFNLAVAQEALAYKAYAATLNPADSTPFFDKALELYDAATKADPNEKYIRQTAERLRLAKQNIARAVDQRKTWESERDKKRNEFIAKREGMKAIQTKREDTSAERSLRVLARNNLSGKNPKAEEMVRGVGEKLNLDEIAIQRIWVQENERLKGLQAYEEQVRLAVTDGLLTKAERDTLDILYPTFNMSEADAREVEARLKFREEGKEPSPAPAPAPAPQVQAPSPQPPTPKPAPKPAAAKPPAKKP